MNDPHLKSFLTSEISKSQRLLNPKHKESYANRKAKIENRSKQLETELKFLQNHTGNLISLREICSDPEKFKAFVSKEENKGFIEALNQYLLDIENCIADMEEVSGRSSSKKHNLPAAINLDNMNDQK